MEKRNELSNAVLIKIIDSVKEIILEFIKKT